MSGFIAAEASEVDAAGPILVVLVRSASGRSIGLGELIPKALQGGGTLPHDFTPRVPVRSFFDAWAEGDFE